MSIQVFGSGGSANLTTTTITPKASTQTYSPSSSYDGYSSVTVNGDSNLVSSNIVSRKSIFGVNGSYSSILTNKSLLPVLTNGVLGRHGGSGNLADLDLSFSFSRYNFNFAWEQKKYLILGMVEKYDSSSNRKIKIQFFLYFTYNSTNNITRESFPVNSPNSYGFYCDEGTRLYTFNVYYDPEYFKINSINNNSLSLTLDAWSNNDEPFPYSSFDFTNFSDGFNSLQLFY